jgi:hypothetical protein
MPAHVLELFASQWRTETPSNAAMVFCGAATVSTVRTHRPRSV